jgi:hypothetical protein
MTAPAFHLFFHSPCFDGIVSAVLTHDFLSLNHTACPVVLHPVNYHLNETWATTKLDKPCAVVDFLYHPDAQIWFDHHSTTFLGPALKDDFLRRQSPMLVYDPAFSSCALLLWNKLDGIRNLEGKHLAKVEAADRIDSARYGSPEEAVFSDAPAMRINASLAIGEELEEYSKRLVVELRSHTLDEAGNLPEVQTRYRRFVDLRDRGLQRLRRAACLTTDGIVVFDVDGTDAVVSRYGSFLFFPEARYSLGIVRYESKGKITAMRNPWLDFQSVPLGEIFSNFGGGGHQRVASTRVRWTTASDDGSLMLKAILTAIRGALEDHDEEALHDRALQFL